MPSAAPRYTARLIKGVEVGPVPIGSSERLTAIGQRSINNIVDVTNCWSFRARPAATYLRLRHARSKTVRRISSCAPPRMAKVSSRWTETERELTSELTVIATPKRAVALAGRHGRP